jgi:hypothetical protein
LKQQYIAHVSTYVNNHINILNTENAKALFFEAIFKISNAELYHKIDKIWRDRNKSDPQIPEINYDEVCLKPKGKRKIAEDKENFYPSKPFEVEKTVDVKIKRIKKNKIALTTNNLESDCIEYTGSAAGHYKMYDLLADSTKNITNGKFCFLIENLK